MKLVDNITVLPCVTRLDIDVDRVLQSAMEANIKSAIVLGEDADGSLYFASSVADGGQVLWWMEKAKHALMDITE